MSKFALLIGINYTGTSGELRGCVNDVNAIYRYLCSNRGYKPEDIMVLTESQATGARIMHELAQLIIRAHRSKATELFLHFSGHGSQSWDLNGDEPDRLDETIVPIDFQRNGSITDDFLCSYLKHIPNSCQMYCLIDACHSGTVLDLHRLDIDGRVVCISGCLDNQTSADAWIQGQFAGAMTSSFIACIDQCNDFDAVLVEKMQDWLRGRGFSQIPLLTESR